MNAVICSDLGVVQLVKENSKIPVHLSTQAFVLNSYHARIWKNLGVKRIVFGTGIEYQASSKNKARNSYRGRAFHSRGHVYVLLWSLHYL